MVPNPKYRGWCFTANPGCATTRESLEARWDETRMAWLAFQQERAESGTLHWQGAVYFKNRVTRPKWDDGMHWEPMRGTPRQAWDYCTKEETRVDGPYTHGAEPKGAGARSDLEIVAEMAAAGASLTEIADAQPIAFIRHHRGIERFVGLKAKHRQFGTKMKIEVHWGDAGSGKTWHAMSQFNGSTGGSDEAAYVLSYSHNGWWQHYNGEKVVIIEEYSGWLNWNTLLNVLDSTPMSVEFKGGSWPLQVTTVIITSNKCPWDWHPKQEYQEPLRRRLQCQSEDRDAKIYHWTGKYHDGTAEMKEWHWPECRVHKIKADDGSLVWKDPLPGSFLAPDGTLYEW